MEPIERGKSKKKKTDFRLDDDLIEDLKLMAILTGTDATAIVHEAVRRYKGSAELKEAKAKYQQELADASASLTGHKGVRTDTGHKMGRIVRKGLKKDRPGEPPTR